uniref:SAM domain-containing protein n=1 Tax=Sphenodon punctatus TaxID=8508 RepID=A0A8D0HCW3_SPHPU
MLNSLMKRDLEKYLNVSKKFHQIKRRARCETQNIDLLVWTNQRMLKWVRDIDLKEYADNLMNSGVHGAVLMLEPTFNAEALATALGIPSSKHILRRHLAEEMNLSVFPRLRNRAGIGGTVLEWFCSFLDGRTQCVVLGDFSSSPRGLTCGVPQGSILSPLLFNVYVQPLGEVVREFGTQCHQYADDTQLYLFFI